jgi:hypothetical protein
LNLRPIAYEATALPTELFRRTPIAISLVISPKYPSQISDKYQLIFSDHALHLAPIVASTKFNFPGNILLSALENLRNGHHPLFVEGGVGINPIKIGQHLSYLPFAKKPRIDFEIFDFQSTSLHAVYSDLPFPSFLSFFSFRFSNNVFKGFFFSLLFCLSFPFAMTHFLIKA